jgi:GNAT superfamily N-acetyltransferase
LELKRLESEDGRPAFSCGHADLDEFYQKDSIEGCKQLLCVTYAFMESGIVVAFFSVSNDAIKREDLPRSAFQRITRLVPFNKRYSSMPAVKIGRLGVSNELRRDGYGTEVLDFIKAWFTQGNKTGCRFLVVDAYNDGKAIPFYIKNGFDFLTSADENEKTRIMYFDLIKFRE